MTLRRSLLAVLLLTSPAAKSQTLTLPLDRPDNDPVLNAGLRRLVEKGK